MNVLRTLVAAHLLGAAIAQDPTPASAPTPDFARTIRPLLSDRCFTCHGPDAAQRKAGLRLDERDGALAELPSGARAIVPGDASRSALVARIHESDPNAVMPPPSSGKTLNDDERELLRRWIDAGAPWAEHWSFAPRARVTPPTVADAPDLAAIDAFVTAALARDGRTLRPRADRATWLRRVTLDLTGLPPTPDELDAFRADTAPGADARVVDRLLTTTRHAEHMARHWLDLARYGDTHGLHLDNERSNWAWRDWVVDAYRRNLPFDRFSIEQLAGDLLPSPTHDQLVATGFHRNQVTTAEGGLIDAEYLAKYAFDRTETTATVWLGLTLGCAQCHDHKYDPISQRDYYRFLAFFQNVDVAASDNNVLLPPPSLPVPTPAQAAEVARLEARIASVQARLDAPDADADARMATFVAAARTRARDGWRPLAKLDVEAFGLAIDTLPGKDGRVGNAKNGNFVLTGVDVEAVVDGASRPVALAAAAASHAQPGFPAAHVVDADPRTGWAILPHVDAPHTLRIAFAQPVPPGTELRVRLRHESVHRTHEIAAPRLSLLVDASLLPSRHGPWRKSAAFAAADARAAFTTDFGPEATGTLPTEAEPVDLVDGTALALTGERAATYLARTIDAPGVQRIEFTLGSDDGIAVWWNGVQVLANDARRAAAPDQERVVVTTRPGPNHLLLKVVNDAGGYAVHHRLVGETAGPWPPDIALLLRDGDHDAPTVEPRLRHWYRLHHEPTYAQFDAERRADVAALDAVRKSIPSTLVVRERAKPMPTHVLLRGAYDRPGEVVTPGVPPVLPPLDVAAPTRLDLARWMFQPDHPLTARVAVNRYWQMFFGTGLVETPEDFGAQGTPPSHPDLLDWLANEFVASGYDTRHVLRTIALSATYAQESTADPAEFADDPTNRRLARGPRHRLDAEPIRDLALFASGLLVERTGGKGVKPYQPPGIWDAVAYVGSNTMTYVRDDGDALHRRSLYTFWKRTAPPPLLQIFDAPSRETCTVRRPRTNTPLQALALWNDEQFVEAARALAARVLATANDDPARVVALFRLVLTREPTDAEATVVRDLLDAQRATFTADRDAATALTKVGVVPVPTGVDLSELAAWTTVANVVLNLDEAITKR